MEYKEVISEDREEWNKLVDHPLQSWEWGEFRSTRQKVTRLGRYEGGKLVKGFLVMWTRIANSPFRYGYIPMGPNPNKQDLEELKKLGQREMALGIRMEPMVEKNQFENNRENNLVKGRNLFKPKTFWLELNKSVEELMENMHPKCRYNIRLAQKKGVIIEEDNSTEAFENYLHLMFGETVRRQKIYSHNRDYHSKMWQILNKSGMAHMMTAKLDEKIIVTWMLFTFKKGLYFAYGGYNSEYKELMAPTLTLWESALWGKTRNLEFFDLWGAEEGKGFSKFKQQFGPKLVEMAGAWDLPVSSGGYKLFRFAEEIRWKILRAMK